MTDEPAASSGMSAWPALPASRTDGSSPREPGPAELGGRHQHGAHEVEPADLRQLQQRLGPGPHGRERREQARDDVVADPVPLAAEREPCLAVPGPVGLEAGRGGLPVAQLQGPAAVRQRVAEHRRRVAPAQAVLLEPQGLHRRGGGCERVERAERVVHEPGVHVLRARDGAAHGGLRLEHQHRPAGVDETVRGDQAVGAGADHHRVVQRHTGEHARDGWANPRG